MAKVCPNCNTNLADDAQFCGNCGLNFSNVAAQQTTPVEQADAAAITPDKNKMIGMIACASGGVIALIIIISIIVGVASSGYKGVVKDYFKAIQKKDFELMMETMPKEQAEIIEDMLDSTDTSSNKYMNELYDNAEEEFGKKFKFSVKFTDKEKYSKEDLKDLNKEYKDNDMKLNATKAYELTCEITVKSKDGKDTADGEFLVAKTKDGWVILEQDID